MRVEQLVLYCVLILVAAFAVADWMTARRSGEALLRDRVVALLGEGPASGDALHDALVVVVPDVTREQLQAALRELEASGVAGARNYALDGTPDVRYVLTGRSPELADE